MSVGFVDKNVISPIYMHFHRSAYIFIIKMYVYAYLKCRLT